MVGGLMETAEVDDGEERPQIEQLEIDAHSVFISYNYCEGTSAYAAHRPPAKKVAAHDAPQPSPSMPELAVNSS